MFKFTKYLVIAIITSSAILASACSGRAPAPASTTLPGPTPAPSLTLPDTENVNFRFLISDDVHAIDDFEHLYITITEIGLERGDESENWQEFAPDIIEMDLKPLTGENALEIWHGNLAPGKYSKVFIYVSSVKGILIEDLGGGEANVKLPGEKLHIIKPFVISEDTTTSFVYDVAVVKAGKSGQYVLKPQIDQSGADQGFKVVKSKADKGEKPEKPGKPEQMEEESSAIVAEKVEVEEIEPEEEGVEVSLEDKTWSLERFGDSDNLIDVLDDTDITIEFVSAKGKAEGSAGCNSYFVSYETKGNQLSIIGPIIITAMFCKEPEGVMDQEQEFLKILRDAKTYEIEDEQLHILSGDIFSGDKVLIFALE